MYKSIYEKYKEKYLTLRHNLKGGKSLVNLLYNFDNNDFIKWYTYKIDDGFNAYEIFKDSFFYDKTPLAYQVVEQPLSILVGATNMNLLDYNRFKDSKVYTLYIDEKDSTNVERQYDMYTIGYQNIFSNMGSYLKEFVRQIHFDTGVTYFCSIDYLKLAENILIKGGKIVFDLMQHMTYPHHFNRISNVFYVDTYVIKDDSVTIDFVPIDEFMQNGIRYYHTHTIVSKESLEDRFNVLINVDQQLITPRIKDSKYGSSHISPQMELLIADDITKEEFKKDTYRGYIDYCTKEYPNLRFEQKTFSFSNYTYPVPIRLINEELHIDSYNPIFNFIFNQIMNLNERIAYIRDKTLSDRQINDLIDRLLYDRRLLNSFNPIMASQKTVRHLLGPPPYTNRNIDKVIYDELKKRFEYIEGTKI
jgi:hypothetical protein